MTSGAVLLADLGVLALRGPDACSFLQGQLSNDTRQLAIGGAQWAGLHTPQGRTLALLRLARPEEAVVLAVLPAELLPGVLERLRRYVLRAKVTLGDESARWRVCGVPGVQPLPAGGVSIPLEGAAGRRLVLLPVAAAPIAGAEGDAEANGAAEPGAREAWRRLDIAAGLPQLYAATAERFVAQMLNLDVLGGIAFDKGCYTGQEVIARAHYRGRVKRRLQRFRSLAPLPAPGTLAPGTRVRLTDGRSGVVLESVQDAQGRCEFLAVAPLPTATADAAPTPDEPDAAAEDAGAAPLDCESLALPYALPSMIQ